MSTVNTTEGLVDFDYPAAGKPCKTWYKIVGDLSCGVTPLVTLHGGPGLTHHYMLPMADFNEKFGIPVIFYDQLGNGLSTHLPDKLGDESFWTDALFHAELSNLVSALNLPSYDILGQSWGGMMGSTFAALKPKGLRKLVLSNSPAIDQVFTDAYNEYRKELPQEVQDTLKRHEDAGTVDSAEYQEAMMTFYGKHMCTIIPFPKDFQTSMEWVDKDGTVSSTMLGPTEWVVTGSMRNWTAVPVIKDIAVPTLVINGTNEGATDEAVAPFVEGIKDVTWIKLKNSTHVPHWEERDNYMQLVGQWLVSQ